ncbi:MAG: hypothetical protein H0X33_07260 [Taibaiella sp.]|nr:hypothetical protein [Taibaiella sp.]
MNSSFANIFLAIQQHVQDQVPDIIYIDQELGQLKNDSGLLRMPIQWPCLLLDFEDFTYEQLATNAQTARGKVILRLGFAPFSNSSQSTPDAYRQKALEYYDIEWALHKAMQGWSPGDDFGMLSRISASTQKRNDALRVRELTYSIAFEDYSTLIKGTLYTLPSQILPEVVHY